MQTSRDHDENAIKKIQFYLQQYLQWSSPRQTKSRAIHEGVVPIVRLRAVACRQTLAGAYLTAPRSPSGGLGATRVMLRGVPSLKALHVRGPGHVRGAALGVCLTGGTGRTSTRDR